MSVINYTNKKEEQENGKDGIKPIGIVAPMDFARHKGSGALDYDKDEDKNEDKNIEKILDLYKDDFDFFGNVD